MGALLRNSAVRVAILDIASKTLTCYSKAFLTVLERRLDQCAEKPNEIRLLKAPPK